MKNRRAGKEVTRDALDAEAIKLLKSDPEKYFRATRRQPFGFVAKDADGTESDHDNS